LALPVKAFPFFGVKPPLPDPLPKEVKNIFVSRQIILAKRNKFW
jgi:hypothetical protein